MAGQYDFAEPDAIEHELGAMFPWAPDEKLDVAARLIREKLDLSGDEPSLTMEMLDNAIETGVAVAH